MNVTWLVFTWRYTNAAVMLVSRWDTPLTYVVRVRFRLSGIYGLTFLLVLSLLRGILSGYSGFPPYAKTSAPNCNITITTEIHARSLANFYYQYPGRHIHLNFMRRVSERERAIRQFVIVKNKLMSVFDASVQLLTMNFVITLSK